jgi:predicted MFS family arabinose efflux permease
MLSTPSPPQPPPPSPARAIAFLAIASFASQAMVRSIDTLLPQIAADFAITVGAASIVVTAYAVTHGSIQLVIGPIGDRLGKYRSVALACALSAVTVFLCGLAGSLDMLAVARLASGATAAWILPLALAFIGDVVPYERRQQVLGRFLAGQVIGQLFGQAGGGVIGDFFGWRNVFFVLGALFALAAAALVFELATSAATRAADRSGRGQARGLRADYIAVFTNPWARFVLVVTFLEGALLQGVFPFVGADLHLRFGLSFSAVGLIVGTFGFGGLIYAASVRQLIKRLGQTGIAIGGGLIMAAAFATLALMPVWAFAPFAVLAIGLGFYMLHNTLQTVGTQMSPEARGTSVALFASVYFIGQTTGVALAAPVVDRFGGPPLFAISAIGLPLLALWFTRRLKAET